MCCVVLADTFHIMFVFPSGHLPQRRFHVETSCRWKRRRLSWESVESLTHSLCICCLKVNSYSEWINLRDEQSYRFILLRTI